MRDVEIAMQSGPRRALHTMHGPKHLLAIRQREYFERLASRMIRGERNVRCRMPILREHDMLKPARAG